MQYANIWFQIYNILGVGVFKLNNFINSNKDVFRK